MLRVIPAVQDCVPSGGALLPEEGSRSGDLSLQVSERRRGNGHPGRASALCLLPL